MPGWITLFGEFIEFVVQKEVTFRNEPGRMVEQGMLTLRLTSKVKGEVHFGGFQPSGLKAGVHTIPALRHVYPSGQFTLYTSGEALGLKGEDYNVFGLETIVLSVTLDGKIHD